MGRKLTGRKLAAKAGTTVICVTAWNLNPSNDVQEMTNSCSNGAKEYDAGLDGGDGSATLVWDAENNLFEGTDAIKPGVKLSLTLSLEAGSTEGDFVVPAIITGTPIAVGVGGRVEVTANFNINGVLTWPTGTIDPSAAMPSVGKSSARGTPDMPVGYVSNVGGKEYPNPYEGKTAQDNEIMEIHREDLQPIA
jgi:hypothetical protein